MTSKVAPASATCDLLFTPANIKLAETVGPHSLPTPLPAGPHSARSACLPVGRLAAVRPPQYRGIKQDSAGNGFEQFRTATTIVYYLHRSGVPH